MKKNTLDSVLRSTWNSVSKMYNREASKFGSQIKNSHVRIVFFNQKYRKLKNRLDFSKNRPDLAKNRPDCTKNRRDSPHVHRPSR